MTRSLSSAQADILERALARAQPGHVVTIGGAAGTGKTELLASAADARRGWGVATLTGKAVDVLRRRGVERAETMHGLMYESRPRTDANGDPVLDSRGRPIFDHRPKPFLDVTGVFVDEASMVPRRMLDQLLGYNVPVIALGDHHQLPPIGDGEEWFGPDLDFELIENFRHGDKLLEDAMSLRAGRSPRCETVDLDDLVDADQVLCATNRTRRTLIAAMRRHRGEDGPPVPGERVICLRNNHHLEVMNGEQLTLDMIDEEEVTVTTAKGSRVMARLAPTSFERGDGVRRYDPEDLELTWADAVTTHKAQGSEWGRVIVLDERLWGCDRRRWRYTAGTRARTQMTWTSPRLAA